jgi:hypothetical protein
MVRPCTCPTSNNPCAGHQRHEARYDRHTQAFNRLVGIDFGKNSFHVVGLDECGAIVLRQKWSRGQGGSPLKDLTTSAPTKAAENKSPDFLLQLTRPFSTVGKYRMQQSFSPRRVGGQDPIGFPTLETLVLGKKSL